MIKLLIETADNKVYECAVAQVPSETLDEINGSYNANPYWHKRNSYKLVPRADKLYIVSSKQAVDLTDWGICGEEFYSFTGIDAPRCGYGAFIYEVGEFTDMQHLLHFLTRTCCKTITYITDGTRDYSVAEACKLGLKWSVHKAVVYSNTARGEHGEMVAAVNLDRVFRASVNHYMACTFRTSRRHAEIAAASRVLKLNNGPAWDDPLPEGMTEWMEAHSDLVVYVVYEMHNE